MPKKMKSPLKHRYEALVCPNTLQVMDPVDTVIHSDGVAGTFHVHCDCGVSHILPADHMTRRARRAAYTAHQLGCFPTASFDPSDAELVDYFRERPTDRIPPGIAAQM